MHVDQNMVVCSIFQKIILKTIVQGAQLEHWLQSYDLDYVQNSRMPTTNYLFYILFVIIDSLSLLLFNSSELITILFMLEYEYMPKTRKHKA